ncbi:MAG TPA: M23 family metallopeptidase, partial [Thermomicrobiales bacterium]|nr:M23 family metallopeptidase [Thermomicrobiales bacterium]
MTISLNRRQFVAASLVTALHPHVGFASQPSTGAEWSLPIRNAGDVPANGFVVRHGFACENTWFSLGCWHTAEDWYRAGDTETAGAEVLAVTAGEVLWVGSDYPGRVVLIQHPEGLVGMYGHLDYAVDVVVGQKVSAGQLLGRVFAWTDGRAPSHLHLEIRNFFYHPIVNGETPKYGFNCGYQCPPGPGYWPIEDSQHPAEIGWRNPQHVIHRGIVDAGLVDTVVVASTADGLSGPIRSAPSHSASSVEE